MFNLGRVTRSTYPQLFNDTDPRYLVLSSNMTSSIDSAFSYMVGVRYEGRLNNPELGSAPNTTYPLGRGVETFPYRAFPDKNFLDLPEVLS